MKISVITLQAVNNYGSVLQALGTQEFFKKHGINVEFINYIRPDILKSNLANTIAGGNRIKKIILFPTIQRWEKVFGAFRSENLNLTEKKYSYEDDFREYICDADAYCTGSDQVWNSKWNRGIVRPLYLNFVPNNKYKFAFASSFGKDVLPQDEVLETKKMISSYSKISVREKTGLKILKNQYEYDNVINLIDPTLCLDADFWRRYAKPIKIKDEYILIYNLNRSKEFDRYALELAKRTGLKLVRLCTRYDQFYRVGKSVLVPEVGEFISLIDNAKYVLTDSFHATAFSMNMNTEPICIYPDEFGCRLADFLELVESEQRHVKNYGDFDVINRKVDFERVNDILKQERKRASSFIRSVIYEIENNGKTKCDE